MILFAFVVCVAVVAYCKIQPRRVVFEVHSRVRLRCGCVMTTEEVSGRVKVKPCAAHQAMAGVL